MIDAHVHFWRFDPAIHTWIGRGMEVLRRDYLPADLEPLLAARALEGCIAVQAAQSLSQTRFLLDLAREHESVRGVVGWVDLRAPDLDTTLDELAADERFLGVRHFVQDEPDPRFLVRPDVVRGIAALSRHDLVFELLVREPQWRSVLELVRALPHQRFVLDHLGKPDIARGDRQAWTRFVRELARAPNVTAKVSGLVTEAGRAALERGTFAPWIETALEAFGRERLVIGSDWPVCLLACDHGRAIDLSRAILDGS